MFAFLKNKIRAVNPGFAAVIALLIIALIVGILSSRDAVPASCNEIAHTLIIDAGHGGIDGGAIGADGTKESEINLAVARRLRAVAEFYGCDNCMVRTDDSTKCDTEEYSERRDLECRANIAAQNRNPVYLSIHQNYYPTGQPNGVQVIYSAVDRSADFAELTQLNMTVNLAPECRRVAEPARDNIYLFSKLSCPAILVECGFMSNFSDMEKLKDSGYQTKIASVLLGSYLQFISEEQKT